MNPTWKRGLALALFVFGTILGVVCAGIPAWGDMEATMFDSSISADAPLNSLRCPVLMTTAETATVSIALDNPLDQTIEPLAEAHISRGYVTWMREERARLSLAPGERKRVEWTVTPDDAAFGRFVLVRVSVLPTAARPYSSGACGIMVAAVPFLSGTLLYVLLVLASLLGLGSGMALWIILHRPLRQRPLGVARGMGILAGLLVAATVLGLLGTWFATLILLLFTLLLLGVMLGYQATLR